MRRLKVLARLRLDPILASMEQEAGSARGICRTPPRRPAQRPRRQAGQRANPPRRARRGIRSIAVSTGMRRDTASHLPGTGQNLCPQPVPELPAMPLRVEYVRADTITPGEVLPIRVTVQC